jgi:hypothetical protein
MQRIVVIFAACFWLYSLPAVAQEKASKPLLHPKIAELSDNTWLKMETPKDSPICRSSSPWMAYAPQAGVGILWGCSHSYWHNDVWTYDLARNEWKEMLKAEPSAKNDPDVIKIKDGLMMTREERPLSCHGWGFMDYDPERQVLWHTLVGGGWQGVEWIGPNFYKTIGREIRQEGDPAKHAELRKKGPPLWQYSLKTNQWKVVYTEDPSGCTKLWGGVIRYFPPLKKLVMNPKHVGPNDDVRNWKLYDPATNQWEPLTITWKPLEGEKAPSVWVWGHAPTVYDAKRQALVLILGSGGTWLLDPVKKTCEQIVAADKSLTANLDCPIGGYVYDVAGDKTLGIFVDYKGYEADKIMQKRGFPTDETQVWALDIEKKAWLMQPKPTNGVLPPLEGKGCIHHYYDPVQNATVIYRGRYNGAGETWLYRFKKAN